MAAAGDKVVLDPAHGLMEFEGLNTLLIRVLQTREMQRLRRIRQLGLAHLVYPGAEHTRLPHALGAANLMVRVVRHLEKESADLVVPELRPDDEVVRDAALAALCHDLGHGPMSHAFENVVLKDWDRETWRQALGLEGVDWIPENAAWHELVTVALLLSEGGEIHQLLERHSKGLSTRVALFVTGKYYLRYLPCLVAGQFDVDRADFILRDALLTGVKQTYDLEWLLHSLTFAHHPEHSRRYVVAVDASRGTHTIQQFLRARIALYRRVYKHKTVRSAELLLGRFLQRLRDLVARDRVSLRRTPFEEVLARILRGEAVSCTEVLLLDDFRLWSFILDVADDGSRDPTLRSLAAMLAQRDLPKLVRDPKRRVLEMLSARGVKEDIDNPLRTRT